MTASIVLALLSALFFAAAGALQHSATRALALRSATKVGWLPVLGLLSRMLRHWVWLCGLICNVMGFVVHSAALHLGSISVVQALLSVQLLFALPLATVRSRTLPLARDWLGTIAVCSGITTLVMSRGWVPQTLDRIALVPFVAVVGLLAMATLVVVAKASSGNARTAFVGTASGIGAILFDQVPPTTPVALASLAVSGALICAGVALLAYSPTIRFGTAAAAAHTA